MAAKRQGRRKNWHIDLFDAVSNQSNIVRMPNMTFFTTVSELPRSAMDDSAFADAVVLTSPSLRRTRSCSDRKGKARRVNDRRGLKTLAFDRGVAAGSAIGNMFINDAINQRFFARDRLR